eukprot:jgi/Psemu1/50260/gm1.50260_g
MRAEFTNGILLDCRGAYTPGIAGGFGHPFYMWSQPNHSLTIALEAPATWGSCLPYTKINKACKFWINRPSPLGETSWNNSNKNERTKDKNPRRMLSSPLSSPLSKRAGQQQKARVAIYSVIQLEV